MTGPDFCTYQGAARTIGLTLLPPGVVDGLGHDRRDYGSQLLLHANSVREQYQVKNGYGRSDERRYVHKALWNLSRKFRQRRAQHERLFVHLDDMGSPVVDVEGALEARSALRFLERKLGPRDFDLLLRVGLAGGNAVEAYDSRDVVSLRRFQERVTHARKRARRFLEDFTASKTPLPT